MNDEPQTPPPMPLNPLNEEEQATVLRTLTELLPGRRWAMLTWHETDRNPDGSRNLGFFTNAPNVPDAMRCIVTLGARMAPLLPPVPPPLPPDEREG